MRPSLEALGFVDRTETECSKVLVVYLPPRVGFKTNKYVSYRFEYTRMLWGWTPSGLHVRLSEYAQNGGDKTSDLSVFTCAAHYQLDLLILEITRTRIYATTTCRICIGKGVPRVVHPSVPYMLTHCGRHSSLPGSWENLDVSRYGRRLF